MSLLNIPRLGKGLRAPPVPCVTHQTLALHPVPAPCPHWVFLLALHPPGCAGAAAGAPGLLVGGDGLGQPVQAVQVVVGGQVLLAGGTDGPGLQASPKHSCTGDVELRASPGLPPASPEPWAGLEPAPVPGT